MWETDDGVMVAGVPANKKEGLLRNRMIKRRLDLCCPRLTISRIQIFSPETLTCPLDSLIKQPDGFDAPIHFKLINAGTSRNEEGKQSDGQDYRH